MSSHRIPRLRAVGSPEGGTSTGDVPKDVLRFATLPGDRRSLLMQVNDLLDEIDYGTVVLVMHEGKVTQIEMSEKVRLSRGLTDRNDRPRRG